MSIAIIHSPVKNPMQSGKGKTGLWLLEYERPSPATPDALMGWNTMPNTLPQVKLTFDSKEEAIAYATAKNIPYRLREPKTASVAPKAYAENFSHNRRKAFDGGC
jgi:hypothetical protein